MSNVVCEAHQPTEYGAFSNISNARAICFQTQKQRNKNATQFQRAQTKFSGGVGSEIPSGILEVAQWQTPTHIITTKCQVSFFCGRLTIFLDHLGHENRHWKFFYSNWIGISSWVSLIRKQQHWSKVHRRNGIGELFHSGLEVWLNIFNFGRAFITSIYNSKPSTANIMNI